MCNCAPIPHTHFPFWRVRNMPLFYSKIVISKRKSSIPNITDRRAIVGLRNCSAIVVSSYKRVLRNNTFGCDLSRTCKCNMCLRQPPSLKRLASHFAFNFLFNLDQFHLLRLHTSNINLHSIPSRYLSENSCPILRSIWISEPEVARCMLPALVGRGNLVLRWKLNIRFCRQGSDHTSWIEKFILVLSLRSTFIHRSFNTCQFTALTVTKKLRKSFDSHFCYRQKTWQRLKRTLYFALWN